MHSRQLALAVRLAVVIAWSRCSVYAWMSQQAKVWKFATNLCNSKWIDISAASGTRTMVYFSCGVVFLTAGNEMCWCGCDYGLCK